MDDMGVRLRGLKQLDRALGRMDKDLRRDLRSRLRDIAGDVAMEARQIAEGKGLRESGDLIRGIRPFALTGRAGVRSNAMHRGYPYPRRLEFEDRGAMKWGPRASLNPAVKAKQPQITRTAERLLDELADDWKGYSA